MVTDFRLQKEDEKIIQQLYLYATQSTDFEKGGYLLKKGILLRGNIGIGKTTLMRILLELHPNIALISTRKVVRGFYPDNQDEFYNRYKPLCFKSYCFDDLGEENYGLSVYGSKINVMAEIIMDSYEEFISKGYKVHFTTNKATKELYKIYGNRVMDRMLEMCNEINWKGESKRK